MTLSHEECMVNGVVDVNFFYQTDCIYDE